MEDNLKNNNLGATYFDDIYSKYISNDLTIKEVDFVISQIPSDGSILDLGCGTGRHLIEITKKGVDITGVDIAQNMVEVVKKKYPPAKVFVVNVYKDKIDGKFNLIILFWNSVMEIARTNEDLHKLVEILQSLLTKSGKILMVNLYNESLPVTDGLDFSEIIDGKNQKYRLTWRLKKLFAETNTTVCEEKIELIDKNGETIREIVTNIEQKWWRKKELEKIAKEFDMEFKEYFVDGSDYHYYMFENRSSQSTA